jgi:hypothetical protein
VRILVLAVALLSGCSSNTAWRISAGTPPADALVSVHTTSDAVAIFGLAIFAGAFYEMARGGTPYVESSARRPPEMAPDRRVSEQDCTKPLDYSLGNIRCK